MRFFVMTGEWQVVVVKQAAWRAQHSLDDLSLQRRTDDKPLGPNGLGNMSRCLRARPVKHNMCRCAARVMGDA